MRTRRASLLAILSAFALVLAACSGDVAHEDPASATGDDGGDGDTTDTTDTETAEDTDGDEAPADDEPWPELTIYIPASAGGGFDIAVRALQPIIAEELGTNVVPVNLEGGGGAIAAGQMLSEPADGSRIMITSRTISSVPYTGTPELDPLVDLVPVGHTHEDVSALTVPADAPYDTIEEFLDYARENPGELQIGHSGIGGVWHAAGLLLEQAADVDFDFIPYGGGSDAGNALIAGEIDAVTIGAPETQPFLDTGDVKMLGIMGEERSDMFPDVPTFRESGVDVVYAVWRGYVASAETPQDILDRLEQHLQNAATSDEYVEVMSQAGFELNWRSSDEFRQLMEEEDQLVRELFGDEDFFTTEPERVASGG